MANLKSLERLAIAGLCATAVLSSPALAEEGGGSVYVPGTFNDFAAGVIGPPGVYLRNDLTIYDASIDARPLGGRVDAGIDEVLVLNLVKLAWVAEGKLLGGTPNLAVVIPIIPHVDADARVRGPGFARFGSGGTRGFGDIFILPAINWASERHNFQIGIGISAPAGRYSVDRAVNLGRNYWAIDPQVTYTFLDPKTGFDLSATAGVLINDRNKASDYRSGSAVHVDATLAKHFASVVALGVTGYWYQQIDDDEGFLPPFLPEGFRGSAAGIGPAISGTVTSGKSTFSVTGKWLHDVETTNRLRGDTIMVSVATKL
ncbi:SphA family protein [Sphingomonas sp. CCH5-D11]|uniref:SphA family protein n=1 Tax=Sphingomonas sp. CCH5-D11 TaxID=1768786 RepID=UPI0008374958|nr:transporter [Sphingomonas sp. CCH5-D11]